MSLTFTEIENPKNILYTIADADIQCFENIINKFNQKYNELFDIYSDFRLYGNHIDYLICLTEDSGIKQLDSFNNFLKNIKLTNKIVLIFGN